MNHYPLLDLVEALDDADRMLAEAAERVETMLTESEGQYPVEAPIILANVAVVREHLKTVLPTSMQTEIAMERMRYADDEAYWSRD